MKRKAPVLFSTLFAVTAAAFFAPAYFADSIMPSAVSFTRAEKIDTTPPPPQIEHVALPEKVRAVYMSQCASASAELQQSLLALADETEINAIVVDVKDYTGTVSFPSQTAIHGGKGCTTSDFRELVKEMHRRGIYVIARITVFQDPLYTATYPEYAVKKKSDDTTWHDYKGLAFVDVGARPFWDYIIDIARETHALGVDELNFDYIRYPSDGPMRDVAYTHSSGEHQENLERFFAYLSQQVRVEEDGHMPVISADLFGMVTTNYDDLNIGQVLERALPYFDFIAPMVYPSHYPSNFHGYPNPNKEVYGVVNYSMSEAVKRAAATSSVTHWFGGAKVPTTTPQLYTKKPYPADVLRPWLQDFDYGGDYGPKEVRDQIQAAYDAGLDSWMLWSPSNRYTKAALELASSTGAGVSGAYGAQERRANDLTK